MKCLCTICLATVIDHGKEDARGRAEDNATVQQQLPIPSTEAARSRYLHTVPRTWCILGYLVSGLHGGRCGTLTTTCTFYNTIFLACAITRKSLLGIATEGGRATSYSSLRALLCLPLIPHDQIPNCSYMVCLRAASGQSPIAYDAKLQRMFVRKSQLKLSNPVLGSRNCPGQWSWLLPQAWPQFLRPPSQINSSETYASLTTHLTGSPSSACL